jgi:hypothetical protein
MEQGNKEGGNMLHKGVNKRKISKKGIKGRRECKRKEKRNYVCEAGK